MSSNALVMVVLIDRVQLVVHVGHEQVHPTVVVEIGGVHAHSRPGSSLFPIGNAGGKANFLETLPGPVHEEEVGDGVVGDKQIEPSIIVYVGGDDSPSPCPDFLRCRFAG